MVNCCIMNCSSNTRDKRNEKVAMFCIPKIIPNQDKRTEELTRERQTLWLARINRKDFGASWRGTATARNLPRVCGKHFVSGRSAKLVDYTNVDWVPTLNLGYNARQAPLNISVGRYERRKRRAETKTLAHVNQDNKGRDEPTATMEFVSIRSEPAAPAVIKQEVDSSSIMDFAPTDSVFCDGEDNFSMEYVDSPSEMVIKDEEDICGSNGEEPAQDNVFVGYQKTTQTNIELRRVNRELGTHNLKLRDTIEALVENNVELQNSKVSLRETRNELCNTNAALVQINIELQNSTTTLRTEKQQLNNEIKDLRLKMQATGRREVVIQSLIDNNNKLSMTNKELQKKLKASEDLLNKNVCSSHFLDDDARCVFYTGLPNKEMFGIVLQETLKILPSNPERISSLTSDQRLLIVLMKLKLNYFHEDLANRFHVSTANVCRILKTWLPCVAQILGSHIVWLSRDDIRQSLPDCFKRPDFEDAVCIFHCFEMDTQKCKNYTAVPTLSGTNTFSKIKFLVGIAPHGAVTFVSEGLAGKVSDDDVAVHSGVLEKLQEKDVVLVDYEYLGHEEFTKRGIRMVIPSLRKQDKSRAELIYNSEVTHLLRGHIQRVIGQLRKFKILSEVLSHHDVTQVGHIVKACAGIVNTRIPVVQ